MIFHLICHSPDGYNGIKAGNRIFSWASHIVAVAQNLGHQQEIGSEVEHSGHELAPICNANITGNGFTHYATAFAPILLVFHNLIKNYRELKDM